MLRNHLFFLKNEIKSAKRTPHTFIHINPLSRNHGSAPDFFLFQYGPIPLLLMLNSVMLQITEILLTRGQLLGHGREARDLFQLGKYGPIPMVLILSSVMLLITEILSTRGQQPIHVIEVRGLLQLGKYVPFLMVLILSSVMLLITEILSTT